MVNSNLQQIQCTMTLPYWVPALAGLGVTLLIIWLNDSFSRRRALSLLYASMSMVIV